MKPDFIKWWIHNGNGPHRGTDLEYHEGGINQFAEDYSDVQMEKFLIWIEAKERLQKMPPKYYKDMVKKFKDDDKIRS